MAKRAKYTLPTIPIEPREAIIELNKIRNIIVEQVAAVARKKWRDSEKAMYLADLAKRDSALLFAIRALQKSPTLAMHAQEGK